MNSKELIKNWNNSGRPSNVQKLINFLISSGYTKDDVINAMNKSGLNIHDTPDNQFNQSNSATSQSAEQPSQETAPQPESQVQQIEKGTQVEYNDTKYTFNGYRWTQGGKLIKNQLNDELTKMYMDHMKSQNPESATNAPQPDKQESPKQNKSSPSNIKTVAKLLAPYKNVVSKIDPTDKLYAAKMAILLHPNKSELLSALKAGLNK